MLVKWNETKKSQIVRQNTNTLLNALKCSLIEIFFIENRMKLSLTQEQKNPTVTRNTIQLFND